jgi:hypothetical protein
MDSSFNLAKVVAAANQLFEKCSSSKLSDIERLIKVSEELREIQPEYSVHIDIESDLIKASELYRSLFKEAALKEGLNETFIEGVFDTSEKLFKQAISIPMSSIARILPNVEREMIPMSSVARMAPKTLPMAPPLIREPGVAPTASPNWNPPTSSNSGMASVNRVNMTPPSPSEQPIPMSSPSAGPAPQAPQPQSGGLFKSVGNFLNPFRNKANPGWWEGDSTPGSLMTGGAYGAGAGLLTGNPLVGVGTGVAAAAARKIGLRRALLAGGGLVGASQLGIPQGAAKGIGEGVSSAVAGNNPSSNLIPGLSNNIVGPIGGFILASLLARQMGLGGIGGTAAGLLGAYGGYKYLPQLLQQMRQRTGLPNKYGPGEGYNYPNPSGGFNPPSSFTDFGATN